MIADLQEQLEFCNNPEIQKELKKEIQYRKQQLQNLKK